MTYKVYSCGIVVGTVETGPDAVKKALALAEAQLDRRAGRIFVVGDVISFEQKHDMYCRRYPKADGPGYREIKGSHFGPWRSGQLDG